MSAFCLCAWLLFSRAAPLTFSPPCPPASFSAYPFLRLSTLAAPRPLAPFPVASPPPPFARAHLAPPLFLPPHSPPRLQHVRKGCLIIKWFKKKEKLRASVRLLGKCEAGIQGLCVVLRFPCLDARFCFLCFSLRFRCGSVRLGSQVFSQSSAWIPNYKGKAKDPKGKGKKAKAKKTGAAETGKGDYPYYQ